MSPHLIEMEKNLLKQYNISTKEEKQSIAHLIIDKEHLIQELEKTRTKLEDSTKQYYYLTSENNHLIDQNNYLKSENDSLRGVIQELQTINESVNPKIIFGNKRKKNNGPLPNFNIVNENDQYFRPNRNKRRKTKKTKKNNDPLPNFNIVNENDKYFRNNFFNFNGNGNFKLPTDLKKNKTKKRRTSKKK